MKRKKELLNIILLIFGFPLAILLNGCATAGRTSTDLLHPNTWLESSGKHTFSVGYKYLNHVVKDPTSNQRDAVRNVLDKHGYPDFIRISPGSSYSFGRLEFIYGTRNLYITSSKNGLAEFDLSREYARLRLPEHVQKGIVFGTTSTAAPRQTNPSPSSSATPPPQQLQPQHTPHTPATPRQQSPSQASSSRPPQGRPQQTQPTPQQAQPPPRPVQPPQRATPATQSRERFAPREFKEPQAWAHTLSSSELIQAAANWLYMQEYSLYNMIHDTTQLKDQEIQAALINLKSEIDNAIRALNDNNPQVLGRLREELAKIDRHGSELPDTPSFRMLKERSEQMSNRMGVLIDTIPSQRAHFTNLSGKILEIQQFRVNAQSIIGLQEVSEANRNQLRAILDDWKPFEGLKHLENNREN